MAVTATNLTLMYTSQDYSDGRMTARWKCFSSEVTSYEVGFEFYSLLQKKWLTDSVSTVQHVTYDNWVTTQYTAPDENTASMVHFIVRPICVHNYTDSKGNQKSDTYYGDYAVSANVEAGPYKAKASADTKYKNEYLTVPPEVPEVELDFNGSRVVVRVTTADENRVGSVRIQRRADGGSWATLKELYRAIGKGNYERDLGVWSPTFTDSTVQVGHAYDYRAQVGNFAPKSDGSGYAYGNDAKTTIYYNNAANFGRASVYAYPDPAGVTMKPSAFTFDSVSLAESKYSTKADGNVTVEWTPTGKTTDHFDVEYSSYFGTDNAWNDNATDQIKTLTVPGTAKKATVAGLSAGVWRFRVYAANDQGRTVGTFVGSNGKAGYATRGITVPAPPQPTFAKPTALANAITDETGYIVIDGEPAARFDWTDARPIEEGASYVVEHSTYASAWANNADTLIERQEVEDSAVLYSGNVRRYTWPRLEKGKTHYFKVKKVADGSAEYYADGSVKVVVPAANPTGLATPTLTALTLREDGRIRATVTTQANIAVGQSVQLQYTDYSRAFAENSNGDISEAELAESSGKTHYVTVSDVDYGQWWFRARLRSDDATSAWSGVKDITRTPTSAGQMAVPKGLEAAYSNGTMTLTWDDDQLETGATYRVEHATRSDAWALNLSDAIDTITTDGDYQGRDGGRRMVSRQSGQWVVKGMTHYFRLFKVASDGIARTEAKPLSKYKNNPANATVPPASETPSLTAPTDLAATVENGRLLLTWNSAAPLASGQRFDVQFADYEDAFADNDLNAIQTTELAESAGTAHRMALSQAEAGKTWWARVRLADEEEYSAWTASASAELPPDLDATTESLGAPTPGTTLGAYPLDADILLSWTHNSGQNSQQSAYQVELSMQDGTAQYVDGSGAVGSEPSVYVNPLELGVADGGRVRWRVRTQGAFAGYWSPWSAVQEFGCYSRPVAGIAIDGGAALGSMPLVMTISAFADGGGELPQENAPLSCAVSIAPTEDVEATGPDGTVTRVAEGEAVWSGYYTNVDQEYSASEGWSITVGAGEVSLQGSASYEVRATVSTVLGMRADASELFAVEWSGELPSPTGSALFYEDGLLCTIWPRCEEIVDEGQGEGPDEPVYGLVEGVTLSVWRVGQDGSTELVADGIPNDGATSVDDPRCSFGTATYRIVATDQNGVQSSDEVTADTEHPNAVVEFGGNLLEIDHNVAWSEKHEPDVQMLRFQGRRDPVPRFGTQRGHSVTLTGSVLDGFESGSLRLLRMLADYRGTCFVREPTGLAWHAVVIPSSISYQRRAGRQDITLEITRVEA